jgi:hypothetical protein
VQLSSQTDLLVLCKFGKTEVEGGGFRSLIAKALELSVPVLVGVPLINLTPFREFSADLAREVDLSQIVSEPLTAAERLRSSNWPARHPSSDTAIEGFAQRVSLAARP